MTRDCAILYVRGWKTFKPAAPPSTPVSENISLLKFMSEMRTFRQQFDQLCAKAPSKDKLNGLVNTLEAEAKTAMSQMPAISPLFNELISTSKANVSTLCAPATVEKLDDVFMRGFFGQSHSEIMTQFPKHLGGSTARWSGSTWRSRG